MPMMPQTANGGPRTLYDSCHPDSELQTKNPIGQKSLVWEGKGTIPTFLVPYQNVLGIREVLAQMNNSIRTRKTCLMRGAAMMTGPKTLPLQRFAVHPTKTCQSIRSLGQNESRYWQVLESGFDPSGNKPKISILVLLGPLSHLEHQRTKIKNQNPYNTSEQLRREMTADQMVNSKSRKLTCLS